VKKEEKKEFERKNVFAFFAFAVNFFLHSMLLLSDLYRKREGVAEKRFCEAKTFGARGSSVKKCL
jgi:hypothetical protein